MRAIALIVSGVMLAGAGCSTPASTADPATAAAPAGSAAVPALETAAPVAVPPTTVTGDAPVAAATTATPTPARRGSPAVASPAAAQPVAEPVTASPAASPPAAPSAPPAPPAPVYREVTIPSGTTLSVELRTAVASNTSAVEDRVQGVLRRALVVDGVEVVPAGTRLSGVITDAQQSGRVKGRARLALRFTSLTVDDTPISIGTAAIAREAEGSKKEDAAKIGIGAGAGAVVGAITGGRKGAAVGGAVGAGAGTGVVLATRGDEVELAAGTPVTTTLTRPLVVQVQAALRAREYPGRCPV